MTPAQSTYTQNVESKEIPTHLFHYSCQSDVDVGSHWHTFPGEAKARFGPAGCVICRLLWVSHWPIFTDPPKQILILWVWLGDREKQKEKERRERKKSQI